MQQIVGFKELKENVGAFAKKTQAGHSFIVVKQSKPLFKISRPVFEEADLEDDRDWETFIDFTKIRKSGVPFEQVFKASKALDNEQNAKASKKISSKRPPRDNR